MTEQHRLHDPNSESQRDALEDLAVLRRCAPPGFTQRVMATLPPRPVSERWWWPTGWAWLSPALAGAVAMLVLTAVLPAIRRTESGTDKVVVQFELHAPEAKQVELVGDLTAWRHGRIYLEGPDESGHWTARMELPAGRYEYLFFVDGRRWVTDPYAQAHRPDGFGNLNAVITL